MTADQPAFAFTPAAQTKRRRIVLHDGETRTVEALGFRCEHGALVLVLPAGCAAAYAPGQWRAVDAEP